MKNTQRKVIPDTTGKTRDNIPDFNILLSYKSNLGDYCFTGIKNAGMCLDAMELKQNKTRLLVVTEMKSDGSDYPKDAATKQRKET